MYTRPKKLLKSDLFRKYFNHPTNAAIIHIHHCNAICISDQCAPDLGWYCSTRMSIMAQRVWGVGEKNDKS